MEAKLTIYKGNLTYVLSATGVMDGGEEVPESAKENRLERDGENYHITILTKSEYQMDLEKLEILKQKYDWSKFAILGIGEVTRQESRSFYHVVWYPVAQKVRELLNLPAKDFHITLGFEHSDIHGISKDLNTLISLNPDLIDSLQSVHPDLTAEQSHQAIGLLYNYSDKYSNSIDNDKLRMKIHYRLKEYDACLEILDSDSFDKVKDRLYIQKSRAYILLRKGEIYNALGILRDINNEDRDDEWRALMKDATHRASFVADTRVKRTINVNGEEIKLSRNFSWLIPLKLAGISIPKTRDQIRAFHHANIGLVVTVMEEERLPKEWFEDRPIENIYYAVENYGTPSIEEMDEIISMMEEMIKNDQAVLVHCGGGKGRAGTVLSCFVAKHGISGNLQEYPQMTATESISYVREMRPGSVESRKQEKFISNYVNHLYKRGQ